MTIQQPNKSLFKRKTLSFFCVAAENSLRQFPRYRELRPGYATRMFRKLLQMSVSKFLMALFKCRITVFLHSVWDYLGNFLYFEKRQRRFFYMIKHYWKRSIIDNSGKWLVWLFIRSLIVTFHLFGTAKFFSKAVALLIKQHKSHFPLFRFLYLMLFSYTQTGPKAGAIPSVLIIVDGKVNGNMRTTKYILKIGTPKLYEIDTYFDYHMTTAYSLYGNMGVRFWVMYTLPYVRPSSYTSHHKYLFK